MLKKLGLPLLLLSAMLLLAPQAASAARWRVRVYGGVTPTYTYTYPYGYGYGYSVYPYYYTSPMYYNPPSSPYYYMYPRHEWREHGHRHWR
jgi:hypothetical protein